MKIGIFPISGYRVRTEEEDHEKPASEKEPHQHRCRRHPEAKEKAIKSRERRQSEGSVNEQLGPGPLIAGEDQKSTFDGE